MNFVYGITSSLLCTAISTFGLNIQAQSIIDETNTPSTPSPHRKSQHLAYIRIRWYVGFILYISFQALGSILGLSFIPATVLAPLGASGLVFNIIFARLILGTQIHRSDVTGTSLIIVGCVLIALFATAAPDTHHDTATLVLLFSRPAFISFFSIQAILTFGYTFYLRALPVHLPADIELPSPQPLQSSVDETSTLTNALPLIDYTDTSPLLSIQNLTEALVPPPSKSHFLGSLYAVIGGVFSSHGMILAKSGYAYWDSSNARVGLVIKSFETGDNQFIGPLPVFILAYLILAIFLQLYAFNQSLIYSLPTIIFPLSYSLSATFALLNSIVYLDQLSGVYSVTQWWLLMIGLTVLLGGVYVLRKRQV